MKSVSDYQMPAKRNLDIFGVLNNIRKHNIDFFDTLNEQQVKEFQPFVIMRWLAGSTNPNEINLLNEIVNSAVFTFGASDKKLLYYLLSISMIDSSARNKFIKPSQRTTATEEVKLLQQYYHYSAREAREAAGVLSTDELLELAEDLGYEKDQLKKLKNELSKRNK